MRVLTADKNASMKMGGESPITTRPLAVVGSPGPPRMRILMLAEMCNPRMTSGPLVAYFLAKALAERDDLDITLVTQVRNRATLESDPIAGLARLHYIDTEPVGGPARRLANCVRRGSGLSWTTVTAMTWPMYIAFEWMAYRRFARDLRADSFDLIHRLSPMSPTVGSPVASLSDVPMLMGPLNGGLPWPAEHPKLARKEREWLVKVRGAYRWLPYYRSTYRHARGVIVGSWHTASEIPSWYRGGAYYIPENGFDAERIPLATEWTPPGPGKRFRFVTVGRLVPYKGFDLILQAMARSGAHPAGCRIARHRRRPRPHRPGDHGDRPRPVLDRLVRRLGRALAALPAPPRRPVLRLPQP